MISSSDGGATWSQPANVRDPSPAEAQSYAADGSAAFTGGQPVIVLPHGDIVVQQGLPPNDTIATGNDPGNGQTLGVDLATDGSGQVAGGWQSLAGNGGDFMRVLAPALGAPQQVPGQFKPILQVAARTPGSGFFAPFTTDGVRVSLQRYGGGAVKVGSVRGIAADKLGVATGSGNRVWVMWGAGGTDIAVTRSNAAVTRFEPIQRLKLDSLGLGRLSGDGQLGPLDLFAHQTPNSKGIATLKLPAKTKGRPAISVTKTGYASLTT